VIARSVRLRLPGRFPTRTLAAMATTAHLNAQQFRPRRVQTRRGVTFCTDEAVGPVHAVAARATEDDRELRAVCGVPVIATLPVWWPPRRPAAGLCPQCRKLAS
jgi:hypothetical protein